MHPAETTRNRRAPPGAAAPEEEFRLTREGADVLAAFLTDDARDRAERRAAKITARARTLKSETEPPGPG